eukprot:CAMPEP_0114606554 /NCGR_PEP_ID=MMETSP0168-20121206/1624_1 /TAXON_ID=95228 ORGANISM="Vannella sp., Strain DIVA3 517/6/12" /NCGR_SAMPLE_ID=MMETSP0168 /ASSEMBLY_ACC=CAM_ASM_000044 /LENGTH=274 /DNA_ID=CAMNT_0001817427 /DNA_START=29 /DNA_END=850 /DNA_ORIENTATION=-
MQWAGALLRRRLGCGWEPYGWRRASSAAERATALAAHFDGGHETPVVDNEPPGRYTVGLMGVRGLHTPEDFTALQQRSVEEVRREATALLSLSQSLRGHMSREGALAILAGMDAVSEQVCLAADTAELCRNVHPLPAFHARAEAVSAAMGGVIHELNTMPELQEAAQLVTSTPSVNAQLSEEQRYVARQLQADFETYQRTADEKETERVSESRGKIWELASKLEHNIARSVPGKEATLSVSKRELLAIAADLTAEEENALHEADPEVFKRITEG